MTPVTALSVIAVLVSYVDPTGSEPRCEYTTAGGKTIYLEYLEFMGKGEAFVEFEDGRICLKRVSCTKNFLLKIEHCHDEAVSCDPSPSECKQRYFPQCCLKCMRNGVV